MRYSYHHPANPADFELLCLRLLQAEWHLPSLQLYGRSGQAQNGVDIFDPTGATPRRAAQCKLTSDDRPIRIEVIRAEVEKAKAFPPLNEYWILSTGKRSTALQREILKLNEEHRQAGQFSVHVLGWNDLEDLLNKHSRVRDEFYPLPLAGSPTTDSNSSNAQTGHAVNMPFASKPAFLSRAHSLDASTDGISSVGIDPISLLVRLAERDRLVIVLGDALDTSVALSRDALGSKLAASAGLPSPDPFVSGSVLEARDGRKSLLTSVMAALLDVKGTPTAPYQYLAQLPISTVVSLFPDPVLEIALTSHEAGYRSIVSDDEMVVRELESGRRELFLLGGSARFGTGLVLTQEDYEGVLERTRYLARGLRDRLALRAILILACDLSDRRFRKLFYWITRHRTHNDGLLFVSGSPIEGSFWKPWNPIQLGMKPNEVLRTLAGNVVVSHQPNSLLPGRRRLAPERPYKYLDFYTARDSDIFFGRDDETRQLAREVLAAPRRVTVLCGRSGIGKTSIIQAGLIPLLECEYDLVARYARCGSDPVESMITSLTLDASVPTDGSVRGLSNALQQVYTTDKRLQVICIDQFEEAFIKLGPRVINRFAEALEECLSRNDGVTRFLIAIREDFLSRLAALNVIVPEILASTYRLDDLSRANAYLAITKPAQLCGIRVEEGLADAILDDLSPTDVLPAHLQVVCDRVLGANTSGQGLTLATYKGLGRASGILAGHLEGALRDMPEDLDPAARSVLSALVTSEKTKDLLTIDEIASRTGLNRQLAVRVCHDLIHRCRLVREVRGKRDAFELSHESLARSAALWLDRVQAQMRAAQDLLDREVNTGQRFADYVFDRDRLRLFEKHRSALYLSPNAVNLIISSYSVLGDIPASWNADVETLSQNDAIEALFYRPVRHNPLLLPELIARVKHLPAELPPEVGEKIGAWLLAADFNSLVRALPSLATAAMRWLPVLAERLESLSAAQVLQLLVVAPAWSPAWAASVISRFKAGSDSRVIPSVASALLTEKYRPLVGEDVRRELATVLRRIMATGAAAQRNVAHVEAARLFVQEVDAADALVRSEDIDAGAVLGEAQSRSDLAAASIAYLFAAQLIEHVTALFRSMAQHDASARAALEQGLRESGEFGLKALAEAVKGTPEDQELIAFACRVVEAGLQGPPSPQARLVDELCKVVPTLSSESLVRVAQCMSSLDVEAVIAVFLGRLPRLSVTIAKELLRLSWSDWWWVAASVLNRSSGVEVDIRPKLSDAVATMSTRAIVSILELKSDISYDLAIEIARGRLRQSKLERHRIVEAIAPPTNAGPVGSIIFLLARVALENSAKSRADLESELVGLLTNPGALDEQRCGPSESLLILDAVNSCLITTRALAAYPEDVRSRCFNSVARFRGHGPQVDRMIGHLCAADPTVAARLLVEGSEAQREGILDVFLASTGPILAIISDALRGVSEGGNRTVRAKALALLIRSGDATAVQSAAILMRPSKRGTLPPSIVKICRDEIARYVAALPPPDLHALMATKVFSDIVLSEMIRTYPEMLMKDDVLSWALKTLGDLKRESAAELRHQLSERMGLLGSKLARIVDYGTSRQKDQARQLLALSTIRLLHESD